MSKRLFPTIIVLFLFVSIPCKTEAGQAKVTYVYDGDTIAVVENGETIKVRLVGIDSPETYKGENKPGQPFSRRSKAYLAELVLNKTVDIMDYGRDDYGRLLGVVYLDGVSVNFEMIRAGLAEVYRAMPPKGFILDAYKETEKEAREARRGMWVQGDNYISPWVWRRKYRD